MNRQFASGVVAIIVATVCISVPKCSGWPPPLVIESPWELYTPVGTTVEIHAWVVEGGPVYTWVWNWGSGVMDGEPSSSGDGSTSWGHFNSPGKYSVWVDAYGDGGWDDACTYVWNVDVVIDTPSSFPAYVALGQSLALGCTPLGATGGSFAWSKASGPGNVTFTPTIGTEDPSFSADQAGDYTVQVLYSKGATVSDTSGTIKVVEVNDVISSKTVACIGENVTFGALTYPPNCAHLVSVTWSGGGTPSTGSGSQFTTNWSTPGPKTVIATCGSSNAQKSVAIVQVVGISATADVTCVGENVHFAALTEPPNSAQLVTVTWSGGGSPATGWGPQWTTNWSTPGPKTVLATCCDSNAQKQVTVVEVASLLPDQGTEVDDGDNDPSTKRYFIFKAPSGSVTITATPYPAISEANLPACWTLTGGTGTGKLSRTISKSTAGTTVITCTAGGSSKKVIFHVIDVGISTVGFTGDHMIRIWPNGPNIDDPDGNEPVWGGGANHPVCYTKNTSPTMFAGFIVTPDVAEPNIAEPNIYGISVRAKVGTTIIGLASGCTITGTLIEDGVNDDNDVDGIGGGSAVPNSNAVKTLTPSFTWEVSSDGSNWFPAGNSGAHTMYFTNATPAASPLYDLGLQKACGYVNGSSNIGGKINTKMDDDITYDPSAEHKHDLNIFSAGRGECCCHAAVFCNLVAHVTSSTPSVTYAWGGHSQSWMCLFIYDSIYLASFQCDRPGHDDAQGNPHFTYHAAASYSGTIYDPSYGLTGWPSFLEMAPAHTVGGIPYPAASPRYGSSLPSSHNTGWYCIHNP